MDLLNWTTSVFRAVADFVQLYQRIPESPVLRPIGNLTDWQLPSSQPKSWETW